MHGHCQPEGLSLTRKYNGKKITFIDGNFNEITLKCPQKTKCYVKNVKLNVNVENYTKTNVYIYHDLLFRQIFLASIVKFQNGLNKDLLV